jgi:hypothetical protein
MMNVLQKAKNSVIKTKAPTDGDKKIRKSSKLG